jgi:hypothetical protein
MLPKTFEESCITMLPKADKYKTKTKTYRPMSLMNIGAKILKNNTCKPNQTAH